MDKYTLRIAHFNKNDIQSLIESVEKVDRMTIKCVNADYDNPETYNLADIILIDVSTDRECIQKILSTRAPYAQAVLLSSIEEFTHLEPAFVDQFFDVWFYINEILRYRITSFIFRMRNVFDAELAQKQLDVLIDSLPDLIWYKDTIGAHIKVNQAFCDTVKKTKEQIKDRGHCYIWDLDIEEYKQGEFVCMETEEVVIKEQKTFLFDEKVKIGNEMRQLKTYKSAILGRNHETIGTVGFAKDVTEIWNSHEEFNALISCLPAPILVLDDHYQFVTCNKVFEEHFNISNISKHLFDIDIFAEETFREDIAYKNLEHLSFERVIKGNNSKDLFYLIEKSPIYDVFKVISGYFYIFRNVTDRYEYEKKLTALSETDDLSQLYNRKGLRKVFDQTIPALIQNQKSLAIILLDIDYFKRYNDHYGHLAGDNVIVEVSKVLRNNQNENVYAFRYGGEEFMIIVVDKEFLEVKEIIESIQEELKQKNIPHVQSLVASNITLSMGLAFYDHITAETSLRMMIDNADSVLYEAKASGRNQYKVALQI